MRVSPEDLYLCLSDVPKCTKLGALTVNFWARDFLKYVGCVYLTKTQVRREALCFVGEFIPLKLKVGQVSFNFF